MPARNARSGIKLSFSAVRLTAVALAVGRNLGALSASYRWIGITNSTSGRC